MQLDVQSGKVLDIESAIPQCGLQPLQYIANTHRYAPDEFAVSKAAMGRAFTATAVVIVDYKLTHW